MQALISEINRLKEENDRLRYENTHAYTFPDGDFLNIEQLGQAYSDAVHKIHTLESYIDELSNP